MKTIVLRIDKKKIHDLKIKKAAGILKKGGLVVFPTDTVYGIAANAFDLRAQKKIYKIKGRSFNKPLIAMGQDIKSLRTLVNISDSVLKIIKKYWPGPLTLVLPATNLGKMIMGGRDNIGVRIPNDKIVLNLLKSCDFPILTTSANVSDQQSAKTSKEAIKFLKNKVDLIFDAGPCKYGKESTVINLADFPYQVIREGCLSSRKVLEGI